MPLFGKTKQKPKRFFAKLRLAFLLFVLFIVTGDAYLTRLRTTDWDRPLRMVIYPINGDSSQVVYDYISSLNRQHFLEIEKFLIDEAAQYELKLKRPVEIRLSSVLEAHPPKHEVNSNVLTTILWSLRMRWWSWTNDNYKGVAPDIRMYVLYFDPANHDRLDHSLGLQKGLIGVVNAFASSTLSSTNNIVITHEMLHTVGASDKYDVVTGEIIFPQGFVDPEQDPLYPQRYAEIMAGKIPQSKNRAVTPSDLSLVVIGAETAREINWLVNE